MNRRKFFALLPAAPVAVATWPAEAATKEAAPHPREQTLVIQGTKDLIEKNDKSPIQIYFRESDPNKQVSMAVGEDGNLWIKPKDSEWKRVVTE